MDGVPDVVENVIPPELSQRPRSGLLVLVSVTRISPTVIGEENVIWRLAEKSPVKVATAPVPSATAASVQLAGSFHVAAPPRMALLHVPSAARRAGGRARAAKASRERMAEA